ncbi:MAG: phosphoserine phosphatase SerB, partial [Cutibacterium sp.]|nr:phosphoserine phosphatase SerB [Cutibacterium sp.]
LGDGANDLDMFAIAGLPIAFCAKPVAVEAARNTIRCKRIDAVRAVWAH